MASPKCPQRERATFTESLISIFRLLCLASKMHLKHGSVQRKRKGNKSGRCIKSLPFPTTIELQNERHTGLGKRVVPRLCESFPPLLPLAAGASSRNLGTTLLPGPVLALALGVAMFQEDFKKLLPQLEQICFKYS